MNRRARLGIGGRLLLAFLGVGGLAVGACIVGWLSYARLSEELNAVATDHLPALAFSARLAEAGANVIASTPDLAVAERREAYDAIRKTLVERLAVLRSVLDTRSSEDSLSPELIVVTEGIEANLQAIDRVAELRFPLGERVREMSEELRWLQADLIEEVEPLIDDARFNMESAIGRVGPGDAAESGRRTLREESRKSEALLTINAHANLIVGLLGRLATVPTVEDLDATSHFIGEIADQLDIETKALASWTDTVTVSQIVARLLAVSDNRAGLAALKRAELAAIAEAQALLAENRRLVTQLGALVSQEVSRTEQIARRAAERSAAAIVVGRNLLLAIAIASLAIAIVVGWFYVRRSLVARLEGLTLAATTIASGPTMPVLPPPTDDELGDLAKALAVFRQTRDDLVQAAKLAALGQMAAGISHELNQPLAAIRSHAHNSAVLIARGRMDEARASLERIQGLTARMAELIRHLKRFARRPAPTLEPVDLKAVVDGALSLFAQRLDEERVAVRLNFPDGPVTVEAEEIRLEQVVVNLVSNALDALDGGGERHIAIGAEAKGGRILLSVSDSGSGIDAEARAAVFDPFFTTKPVGQGLGLGLSMSYNIVKDFGGALSLAQTGPAGTTFVVELAAAGQA
ncbi:His Kinase A (phospho-acceptor) domain/HAMP domain/Histidine kinase-, DNA gyrase B-, and HSP90-like ATPase [Chelatococcus sambhunathii]|uniref:histidine kinase n=1 Tax=Chelatococcus sambhunathii TaxID=363953 RepID=A0ABM9U5D5_9HYPH|nr:MULTISPECIES: ATP-binding protein [Chelatococcus]CUA87372.1 His Kinase A (phospho-acceptor) domain/HAMP domain/Histidine kinase-, DNA gyrase B-, and HSP90-like ATPase [Chelatococcus sambhunathii]